MSEEAVKVLPVLPLKNTVLFPYLLMPLSVGRSSSLAAVQAALATEEKEIVLVAQRDPGHENPTQNDLYTVGTKAVIRKMSRPNENLMEVLVMGTERVVIVRVDSEDGYLKGRILPSPLPEDRGAEVEALMQAIVELAGKAVELAQPQAPPELARLLSGGDDPLRMCFLLASMLSLDTVKEQALLEAATRAEALRLMHAYLSHEVQVLELKSKIANNARSEMSKEQRDYLLRQQMRAIQQELGEKNPEQAEVDDLREQLEKADLPDRRPQGSSIANWPAGEAAGGVARAQRNPQLPRARARTAVEHVDRRQPRHRRTPGKVLDEDHYGLKEVKERILEHLGVLKHEPEGEGADPVPRRASRRRQDVAGPVDRSGAGPQVRAHEPRRHARRGRAARPSADLHRRDAGALDPGGAAGQANNPVLMLDEIDKLGRDFRGDPAAALLEILDPAQNKTFRDNYLDLPFDLSKVFFITTANTLDTIPRPLLDRMEILRLSGYTRGGEGRDRAAVLDSAAAEARPG